MKTIYTHNIATDIVECFEDLLEEKDITIPDDDREENEGEARIYGMIFANLLSDVESIIVQLLKDVNVDYVSDEYE